MGTPTQTGRAFSGLWRNAEKRAKLFVFVFFVALTLIGLLTSADYGLPCDEPWEQDTLRENMFEYAMQLFGADSDAAQYYESRDTVRISESTERDHGQSAYYLATPLLQLQESDPHLMTVLWHAYTWLWFMAAVWAIYAFGREMGFSRLAACLSALLLYLAPRFFAEGHYNSKDVVLLSLVLLSLWLGIRFLKKMTLPRGLLFSLLGAMAGNTKIAGLIGWGLVGLCAICLLTARRQWTLRTLGVALATVAGFALFYLLLTPAMWPDTAGYLQHALLNAAGFTRWPGVVIFRGMRFEHAINPLPRYYLPYMIAVTLPLYTLPLAAVGQLSALRGWWRAKASLWKDERQLMLLAVTLVWLLPLGYAVLARPLVYNGWRHFYFVYAGIALLGGQGLNALLSMSMQKKVFRRIATGVICLCFASSAVGIALNHPYQYGYYNTLVRQNAQEKMELDYWDVSTVNAMEQLASLAVADAPSSVQTRLPSLPLVLGARDPMSEFGISWGYTVLPTSTREILSVTPKGDASYLFYNTSYALLYGVAPPEGYRALFTIESYGNTLCTVYERLE